MSADDLMAGINQARDKLQGARELIKSVEVPPGKKLTDSDRRAVWRQFAENNSVLFDPQREEVRNRGYLGPQEYDDVTGKVETWQLSHEDLARREGGDKVVPRSLIDHAIRDPYAYRFLPPDGKKLADAISTKPDAVARHSSLPPAERARIEELRDARREAFWNRDGYREYDPRTWGTSPTAPPTNTFTESPTAQIVDTAGETPSGGVLRGANKFLGPVGHLLDAYSLYEAYDADGGFGENFRETAGGIAGGAAGGWGGAAAGAAIGTAIFPVGGTVVGGIVGGIAGGIGGEKVGEFLGGLF